MDEEKKYGSKAEFICKGYNIVLTAPNIDLIKTDDFAGFFNDRKERILSKTEKAMGKKINRDVATDIEGVYTAEEEEE